MATLKAKCEGLSANSPCKEACDALKAAMKSCGKSARKLQHCVNRRVRQEWNKIGRGNRAAARLGAVVTSIALGRNISVKNVLRGGGIIVCKARLGGRSLAGIGENGTVGSAMIRLGRMDAQQRAVSLPVPVRCRREPYTSVTQELMPNVMPKIMS